MSKRYDDLGLTARLKAIKDYIEGWKAIDVNCEISIGEADEMLRDDDTYLFNDDGSETDAE